MFLLKKKSIGFLALSLSLLFAQTFPFEKKEMARRIEHDVASITKGFRESPAVRQTLRFLTRDNSLANVTCRVEENRVKVLRTWPWGIEGVPTASMGTTEKDVRLFIFQVAEHIAKLGRCKHCTVLCASGEMCPSCRTLMNSRLVTGPCILCTTKQHPIAFICDTCKDSQICSMCYPRLLHKRGCQSCRLGPVKRRFRDWRNERGDTSSEEE